MIYCNVAHKSRSIFVVVEIWSAADCDNFHCTLDGTRLRKSVNELQLVLSCRQADEKVEREIKNRKSFRWTIKVAYLADGKDVASPPFRLERGMFRCIMYWWPALHCRWRFVGYGLLKLWILVKWVPYFYWELTKARFVCKFSVNQALFNCKWN